MVVNTHMGIETADINCHAMGIIFTVVFALIFCPNDTAVVVHSMLHSFHAVKLATSVVLATSITWQDEFKKTITPFFVHSMLRNALSLVILHDAVSSEVVHVQLEMRSLEGNTTAPRTTLTYPRLTEGTQHKVSKDTKCRRHSGSTTPHVVDTNLPSAGCTYKRRSRGKQG